MSERYYEVTADEAMSLGPKSDEFHTIIIGYLYGRREKPVKLIQSGIQSVNYEIKKINDTISSLGLFCFGEKKVERRRLIAEKNVWKQYVCVLNEILELRSTLDLVEVPRLLEKYENLTQFRLR